MSKTIPLFDGIDTIIIRVKDIAKSKLWYKDKLGFEIVWEDTKLKLVVLNTGGKTSLTLWQTEKEILVSKETASYPIFGVKDAALVREQLINNGVIADKIITDDHTKYFTFYDSDGNIMEACEVVE